MQNFSFIRLQKTIIVLIGLAFFYSCSTENIDQEIPEDFIIADAVYSDTDCSSNCLLTGGDEFFVKGGTKNVNVGPNEKEMSYSAYNTEDSFVVNVTYGIVDGNSGAEATISVLIGDNERIFQNIVSGTTVTHTVDLPDGWAGCDAMTYFVRQEALGEPVEFSGSYNLVPVCKGPVAEIGDSVPDLGGIVFYILQEGDLGYDPDVLHGLVVTTETSAYTNWDNGEEIFVPTSQAVGTGQANTIAIKEAQGEGEYAAKVCNDLTNGGFDDWYLPSYDELILIYENLHLNNIGNFTENILWSSSNYGTAGAYAWSFSTGGPFNSHKSNIHFVRAVRSF